MAKPHFFYRHFVERIANGNLILEKLLNIFYGIIKLKKIREKRERGETFQSHLF